MGFFITFVLKSNQMNKITPEELEEFNSVNNDYRNLKFRVADLHVALHRSTQELSQKATELAELEGKMAAKYGEVTIDMQTGEYK